MTEEISTKNTKNEILDAYNEVLRKSNETKKVSKQEEKAIDDKKEIISTASKNTTEAAEKFPAELLRATQETEKNVTEKLKFKYDFEAKLAQKKVECERKLHQQMIVALEAKVASLEMQIKQLTDKSNQANLQVQDIAVKAIEGASRQRYLGGFTDKSV